MWFSVIAAYRDATRLVQRLREKQTESEGSGLPKTLTKELEDSLALGSMIVQSQYDRDVRRFGETYTRGDALAREQIKDIVITLQDAVISHLHEVFMEEADLDLGLLKETCEDSRVNATVCLGQLYQRMSTAEALREQVFRDDLDQSDSGSPSSVPRSNSHRTHSSGDGGQSATSHTTYNSNPRTGQHRNPSDGPLSHEAVSMSSKALPDMMHRSIGCTPNELCAPDLPFFMQSPDEHGTSTGLSNGGWISRKTDQSDAPAVDTIRSGIDTRGPSRVDLDPSVMGKDCPQEQAHRPDASPEPLQIARGHNVPMNPDYSTLELVEPLEVHRPLIWQARSASPSPKDVNVKTALTSIPKEVSRRNKVSLQNGSSSKSMS